MQLCPRPIKPESPARVLVVDDDPTLRETLRAWLCQDGYEVRVARALERRPLQPRMDRLVPIEATGEPFHQALPQADFRYMHAHLSEPVGLKPRGHHGPRPAP